MTITRRQLVGTLVAIFTAFGVGYTIYLSLDPDEYFYYFAEDVAKWEWDPFYVGLYCLFIVLGGFITAGAFLLRKPTQLWLRCSIALLILGSWAAITTMSIMHMPHYITFQMLWFWAVSGTVLAVALGSLAHSSIRAIKSRQND